MTKAYSDRTPWISMTPEKPVNHPGRARNRADCVVGERSERGCRKAAEIGSRPGHQPDKVQSDGKKIGSDPSNVPVGKSKKKKLDGQVKLPEKFEILGKFFDSLDSTIRLLQLMGSGSTFTDISPKMECLTDS
ncbi:CDT1-like protein b [Camellia lanceoleosa]|uniref:CDT1-like protein b n=1 Tax=Camellia lanceoleosa TaxID=1840588 RepID=A0ACC0FVY1_9ERIC|nr:CDT1-like protein b [Camellia lanceoleosa]